MTASAAVVFDRSALLVLGQGHRLTSEFVAKGAERHARHAYVPTLCLAAADAQRDGLAEHVGSLPAAEIVQLDYPAAVTIGSLLHDGVEWHHAHAVQVARPSAEWPDGLPVLTTTPEAYADVPLVRTIRIPDQTA
ncbi:hypothetical protein G5C51_25045 [Streptomyces sp. A7024]|uniref:Uncharacterized protein n=1 Tax=Streptomyces coryli TaxID=1128680 RepID=A0A6G4U580_9ACTN|nr:hypothetical protein [Streptomyces coryli]NGN67162.1 hypothetical protein [Streptomyces coryli]